MKQIVIGLTIVVLFIIAVCASAVALFLPHVNLFAQRASLGEIVSSYIVVAVIMGSFIAVAKALYRAGMK
jgi:hypothetical protein